MIVHVYLKQDGGSLDLILKKAGRIPEPILGKLTSSVSYFYTIMYDLSSVLTDVYLSFFSSSISNKVKLL